MKKRYAIVSVDDKCPPMLERKLKVCRTENNCFNGKCPYENIYGDTKEQLIRKVEQVLKRSWLSEDIQPFREVATEIVEFLGIKD